MEFVGDDVLEFMGHQIVWSWWCSAQELYEDIELVQASTVRY